MAQKIEIGSLHCTCSDIISCKKIAYILYPMDGFLDNWIDTASKKHSITIVVITGMDWQNVFSPWVAKGVPEGSADFKGQAPEFLNELNGHIIPHIETCLGMATDIERTLFGVSMSGLFALWQWILCDTFLNIASLSGSFWYEGFMDWIKNRPIPPKTGKAFFLLGNKESESKTKAFNAVGQNTRDIVSLLQANGIDTLFQSVPGNHYSNPIPRLDAAFTALYPHNGLV